MFPFKNDQERSKILATKWPQKKKKKKKKTIKKDIAFSIVLIFCPETNPFFSHFIFGPSYQLLSCSNQQNMSKLYKCDNISFPT